MSQKYKVWGRLNTKSVKSSEHGEEAEGDNESSHLGDHSAVEAWVGAGVETDSLAAGGYEGLYHAEAGGGCLGGVGAGIFVSSGEDSAASGEGQPCCATGSIDGSTIYTGSSVSSGVGGAGKGGKESNGKEGDGCNFHRIYLIIIYYNAQHLPFYTEEFNCDLIYSQLQ